MMPFGMSLGAGGFHHHIAGGAVQRSSSQQQHAGHLRKLTTAAAAATAGVAGMHMYRTGRLPLLPQLPHSRTAKGATKPLIQIPRELAEVICGAVGEIVQVAVLYPLDTIKVRCQAGGLPVSAVLQQLMGAGSSPHVVMRQLYAGVVSASLASVAVGSLYYFTFCAAKRAATKMVAKSEQQAQATTTTAAAAGTGLTISTTTTISSSSSSSSGAMVGSPRQYPHGSGLDCHGFDPVFAAICSDDKAAAAAAAAAAQLHSSQQAATTTAATSSSSSSSSSAQPELSSNGKLQANILAACAAAVVGALVEAPVELFKHRAQAGQITGPMVTAVTSALKQHGPAALYGSFFIPFLFKSLPFDIGELMTYSSLNDWRAAQQKSAAAAAAAAGGPSASILSAGNGSALAAVPAPAVMVCSSLEGADIQQQQQQLQGMPALASLTAASLNSSSSSSGGGFPWPSQVVNNMPDHVWDMTVGAAAGAAAVLISMPPDCIKTVMETGGGVQAAAGGGPLRSASAFVGTGQQLVAQHGPRGLFMGLTPRLVESVPSTMLYWLAVEGCRRMLEPYVAPEAGSSTSSTSS